MRTTKNNPTEAQLSLSYQLYPENLVLNEARLANDLFLKLWKCQDHQDGWYVLFLDDKQQFKCWYYVANFLEIATAVRGIVGTAIGLNVKNIVVSRIDNGHAIKLGYIDVLWLIQLLKTCKKRAVVLKDYLVITKDEWVSYKDDIDEVVN